MGLRGNKDQPLIAENAALAVRVEMLTEQLVEKREEICTLNEALRRTQDALIAKEAPDAYADHRIAEIEAAAEPTEEQKAFQLRRQKIAKVNAEILKLHQAPLFKDAEDMIAMLTQSSEKPELKSLHDNGES